MHPREDTLRLGIELHHELRPAARAGGARAVELPLEVRPSAVGLPQQLVGRLADQAEMHAVDEVAPQHVSLGRLQAGVVDGPRRAGVRLARAARFDVFILVEAHVGRPAVPPEGAEDEEVHAGVALLRPEESRPLLGRRSHVWRLRMTSRASWWRELGALRRVPQGGAASRLGLPRVRKEQTT
eukprot:scaffold1323_cov255-Pinguiococcus_pyrenoidosus.AAC.2